MTGQIREPLHHMVVLDFNVGVAWVNVPAVICDPQPPETDTPGLEPQICTLVWFALFFNYSLNCHLIIL